MQPAEGDRTAAAANRPSIALRDRLAEVGRFSRYALRRFNRDGCFAAASALSYMTVVSLVPLGVIALGVLSMFPEFAAVRETLLGLIFRNFVPQIGEQAAWWFEHFAESAAQATAIGIIGIAATGILLLATIEDQLNAVWRVQTPRPWGKRVGAYWTLMTLGPLLVGVSLTLSTYLDHAARSAGLDPQAIAQYAEGRPHFFARLVPFSFELVACTLLYRIIPNCRVRWRDGAAGAAVAATAIELLKIGFTIYVGSWATYQTVYGAVAAVPIFLFWMYLSWMAVLLGAVVAANLPTWRIDERVANLSGGGMRLGFALALIATLARVQRRGATCRTTDLARELGVATSVVDEHLQRLAPAGFVAQTQDGGWVLAWSLASATLDDLYRALDLPLAGSWLARPLAAWQEEVSPAMERIVKAEAAAMRVTLAELLAEIRRPAATPVRAARGAGR